MLITGPLNDRGVVWVAKRNRGIYEPEFRLILVLSMLFGVFGYVGWGVGSTHNMPWIGAVACITYALLFVVLQFPLFLLIYLLSRRMLNFSMVVSGATAVTYVLDTHRTNAMHILAVTNFIKNMVLYASTFFANGLVQTRGPRFVLLVLCGCQAVCWLASVPMYIFGKRVRAFVSVLFGGLRFLQQRPKKLRQWY